MKVFRGWLNTIMNRIKYNLIGGGFQHAKTSTLDKESKYLEWEFETKRNPETFYVDYQIIDGLKDKNDGKRKYAWLMESRAIVPTLVEHVIRNLEQFLETYEAIFTHDQRLLNLHDKFKWTPAYGFYIEKPNLYEKKKLVSMITSNKTMTKNHIFRNYLAGQLKDKLDLYGRGYNEIETKDEGLNDYMFSIAVENDCYETYFTEKILDCFALGTIPVYLGTPDIGEYFNMEGIIILDESFDINNLTEQLYHDKIEAVKDNFNRVLNTIGIPLSFAPFVGDAYDATTAAIFGARALGEKDPDLQQKHAADAAYAGIAAVPGAGDLAKVARVGRALGGLAPVVQTIGVGGRLRRPAQLGAPVAGMAAHAALWPDEPDKTHQKTPGADQSIMDTKNIGSMVDFLTKSNIPGGLGNYSRTAALPGRLTWSGNQSLAASYERVATGIVQNLNEVRGGGMPARTLERLKGALAFLAAPAGIAALAAIAGPIALGALGKESQEGDIALGEKGERGAGGAETAVSRLASVTGYIPQFNPAAAGLQALARRATGVMA